MPSNEDFAIGAVPIEERDWTPQEWRVRKRISKSTHLKMKKAGLAPEEEVVILPGFNLARITPRARADWDRKIAELRQSKEAELERARRQAQVEEAGRLAAQSPNHISKNRAAPCNAADDARRLPREKKPATSAGQCSGNKRIRQKHIPCI